MGRRRDKYVRRRLNPEIVVREHPRKLGKISIPSGTGHFVARTDVLQANVEICFVPMPVTRLLATLTHPYLIPKSHMPLAFVAAPPHSVDGFPEGACVPVGCSS